MSERRIPGLGLGKTITSTAHCSISVGERRERKPLEPRQIRLLAEIAAELRQEPVSAILASVGISPLTVL